MRALSVIQPTTITDRHDWVETMNLNPILYRLHAKALKILALSVPTPYEDKMKPPAKQVPGRKTIIRNSG